MENILSGQPISHLSNLENEYDINKLIAITVPHATLQEDSEDANVTLSSLIKSLLKDITEEYGSMFSESSSDYSLKNHEHNQYSKLSIKSFQYGEKVMQVDDSGMITDINDVTYSQEQWWICYIGQLKFVASTNYKTIDIDSPSFDGWLYADGTKYVTTGFEQAKKYLVGDISSFTVPSIQSFFRCSGAPIDINNGYPVEIPYNVALQPHRHEATLSFDGNSKVELSVTIGKTAGNGGYSRAGKSKDVGNTAKWSNHKVGTISLKADSIEVGDMETDYTSNTLECETYPNHNCVQVMIYVGEK